MLLLCRLLRDLTRNSRHSLSSHQCKFKFKGAQPGVQFQFQTAVDNQYLHSRKPLDLVPNTTEQLIWWSEIILRSLRHSFSPNALSDMPKEGYYAVAKGRTIGIFRTW